MEFYGIVSLFAIMLLLAALPSASVGFVVASSATRGLSSGIAAAVGIVVGDLIFVALALLGMTALAETMGSLFVMLRYLGAAYLVWTGIGLICSAGQKLDAPSTPSGRRCLGTFSAALLLTLGDIKAILFYASLFPVFIDLEALTALGVIVIVALTTVSVGGVKLLYALSANRIAARLTSPKLQNGSRILAGSAMIGAGGFVIAKS